MIRRTTTARPHDPPGPAARAGDRGVRRRRRREGGEGAAADEELGGTSPSGRWAPRARSSTSSPRTSWRRTPDVTVNVTPIAWDVAHDKLLTSVAGGETPDVSQMGTTWMGEFAKTGALEEVPDSIDMNSFFEGARNTAIVDDKPLRRAVVRRDAAPLLPHGHRREGRHHRAAGDLGRAEGDGEGAEGEGRRQVRHLAGAEQLAGVPAVRLAERRRRRERGRRVDVRHARGRRGARVLQVVLRRGAHGGRGARRASTSRRASSPGRTRCSSAARGT